MYIEICGVLMADLIIRNVSDALFRAAKVNAAAEDKTLKEFVVEVLAAHINKLKKERAEKSA